MEHSTTVTLTLPVQILLVLTHVNVKMVTLGMDILVIVSSFISHSQDVL